MLPNSICSCRAPICSMFKRRSIKNRSRKYKSPPPPAVALVAVMKPLGEQFVGAQTPLKYGGGKEQSGSQDRDKYPAKSPSPVSNSAPLPLKAQSTVHHKSRGTVVSSLCFDVGAGPNGVDCESENETVEMEFEENIFSAAKVDVPLPRTKTVRKKRSRTDTVTSLASLRIDCSYEL